MYGKVDMASFCKQCSEETFGEDSEDFKGIVPEGHLLVSICEGCGFDAVMNHLGECVSHTCLKQHGKVDLFGKVKNE